MPTLTFKKDNKGYSIKATITEFDNTTPHDLTGITPTLQLKDKNDVETTKTLEGTVVDADDGVCRFDVPADFFDEVTSYDAEIELTDNAGYLEDTKSFKIKIVQQVVEEE